MNRSLASRVCLAGDSSSLAQQKFGFCLQSHRGLSTTREGQRRQRRRRQLHTCETQVQPYFCVHLRWPGGLLSVCNDSRRPSSCVIRVSLRAGSVRATRDKLPTSQLTCCTRSIALLAHSQTPSSTPAAAAACSCGLQLLLASVFTYGIAERV